MYSVKTVVVAILLSAAMAGTALAGTKTHPNLSSTGGTHKANTSSTAGGHGTTHTSSTNNGKGASHK